MQIDKSQLRFFRDDQPLLGTDQEPLEKMLFRLPKFAQADVDRWAKPPTEIAAMLADPDSYRFEMFELSARVVGLREIQVLPETARRLGYEVFYEATLEHDGIRSIVYVRTIPERWLTSLTQGQAIREHVRTQALLLRRAVVDQKQILVFASSRLNWHPRVPSERLDVGQDQVLLAQLGVDLDRLDEVVQKSRIVGEDRECFYQMLAAVRFADAEQLAKVGRTDFDIARLIRTPEVASGELYTLSGLARRAIKIQVPDADIQERFNIDHYYEIEIFIPLEKQVRFVDKTNPSNDGKVFTEYPFVVCVPELPPGMVEGDDIRVRLSFSAFFMKLWAYRTQFMSADQPPDARTRLQQSPLLIGPTVRLASSRSPQVSNLSLIVACVFTASLLGTWFILWRAGLRDDQQSKRLFSKNEPVDRSFESLRDQADTK